VDQTDRKATASIPRLPASIDSRFQGDGLQNILIRREQPLSFISRPRLRTIGQSGVTHTLGALDIHPVTNMKFHVHALFRAG
jgi:hypothetical protein